MMDSIRKNNAFFRQLLFLGLLITIGLVILRQLGFFIGSFLGAITIYIVVRSALFRLTEVHRWKPWTASMLIVGAATILLLALGFVVFEVIASEVPNVDTTRIISGFHSLVDRVNGYFGMTIVSGNLLKNSGELLTKLISSLLNTTYSFAINVFLMLVILYFMLIHARKMEQKVSQYIPFEGRSLAMLKQEAKSIIYSNAVGIPVVMISQALAASLFYWMFGLTNIVFWAFVTAVCGLLPMVGTLIVSIPLGTYLIAGGEVWQGILLIACGLLVIANVDNLVRIVLMKKITNTHPLIVIFGVIMGIPLFGFWGIIFGPLLISGFLLLIRIYYYEYRLIPKAGTQQAETP